MKPCDTGMCNPGNCSDEKCKEGLAAITEVVIAPMEQSAAHWMASASAGLSGGTITPENTFDATEFVRAETLKKCYEIGAHYRKVTIYYSDWSGQMDHVDSFRPDKGLSPSARKKAVDAELERRGFFLA